MRRRQSIVCLSGRAEPNPFKANIGTHILICQRAHARWPTRILEYNLTMRDKWLSEHKSGASVSFPDANLSVFSAVICQLTKRGPSSSHCNTREKTMQFHRILTQHDKIITFLLFNMLTSLTLMRNKQYLIHMFFAYTKYCIFRTHSLK